MSAILLGVAVLLALSILYLIVLESVEHPERSLTAVEGVMLLYGILVSFPGGWVLTKIMVMLRRPTTVVRSDLNVMLTVLSALTVTSWVLIPVYAGSGTPKWAFTPLLMLFVLPQTIAWRTMRRACLLAGASGTVS